MTRRTDMDTRSLRRWSTGVSVLIVVAIALFIYWLKRRFTNPIRYPAGQAIIRYIQLHDQCSEEEAYQRLAAFIKRHIPLDDWSFVDYRLAHDRQSLLALAQQILMHNPDEIDEI
jgi:hypothetical protein